MRDVDWVSEQLFECDCWCSLHSVPDRNRCQSRDAKMVVLKVGQDGN